MTEIRGWYFRSLDGIRMGLWMEKLKTAFTGFFVLGLTVCLGGCALDSSFLENLRGSAEAVQESEPLQMQESASEHDTPPPKNGKKKKQGNSENAETVENEENNQEAEDGQASDIALEETLEPVADIYYAYFQLDTVSKKLYHEILSALTNLEESITISTLDKSLIDKVFYSVMNDHPELFYVEGYQYTEYSINQKITSITFQGTYSMTAAEAAATREQIDKQLADCFREVPLNEDEYNTVKYLYDYLIHNTEYDKNAANNQNICSVFLQGRSVCQGYAKALQYMLQNVGMQALVVTGFTNGERHAWNLVRVNGAYYYIDPTWGDASYSYSGDLSEGSYTPPINYDYFLVTTDELTRTHSIEMVVPLPDCVSVDDNYFVREGLYYTDYNKEMLALVFESDAAKAADYIILKCSTPEVYDEFMQKLISDQEIFDFVASQGGTIAYTSNQNQRTISFWNFSGE